MALRGLRWQVIGPNPQREPESGGTNYTEHSRTAWTSAESSSSGELLSQRTTEHRGLGTVQGSGFA